MVAPSYLTIFSYTESVDIKYIHSVVGLSPVEDIGQYRQSAELC